MPLETSSALVLVAVCVSSGSFTYLYITCVAGVSVATLDAEIDVTWYQGTSIQNSLFAMDRGPRNHIPTV